MGALCLAEALDDLATLRIIAQSKFTGKKVSD